MSPTDIATIRRTLDRYTLPLPPEESFAAILASAIPAGGIVYPLTVQGAVERMCIRLAARLGVVRDPVAYAQGTFRQIVRGQSMVKTMIEKQKKKKSVPIYEPPMPSLRAEYTDDEWEAHQRRCTAKKRYAHRRCLKSCTIGCPVPSDPGMPYPRWAFDGWYSPTEKFPPDHAPPPHTEISTKRPCFR